MKMWKRITDMKTIGVILIVAATSASAASASIINLFDTGVVFNGTKLSPDDSTTSHVADTHYAINKTNFPNDLAFTFFTTPYHTEVGLDADWISTASAIAGAPKFETAAGLYDYIQPFVLGADFKTAVITGQWAADNCAEIFVNGTDTGQNIGGGITNATCSFDSGSFINLSSFSLDFTKSPFIMGTNTLDFRVLNDGGSPTALLVTKIQGNTVPEPSSLLFMATGVASLCVSVRRRIAARRKGAQVTVQV